MWNNERENEHKVVNCKEVQLPCPCWSYWIELVHSLGKWRNVILTRKDSVSTSRNWKKLVLSDQYLQKKKKKLSKECKLYNFFVFFLMKIVPHLMLFLLIFNSILLFAVFKPGLSNRTHFVDQYISNYCQLKLKSNNFGIHNRKVKLMIIVIVMVKYGTVRCSAVQCNAVQYN